MKLLKFNKYHPTRRNFLRTGTLALPFIFMPKALSFALLKEQFIHRTAFAMGTTVSIQAFHPDRMLLHNAMNKAFDELNRLDHLFSIYKPDSDISQINRSAGKESVSVHSDTINIILRCLEYSRMTNGTFDCTVEPLMKLWGFRDSQKLEIPVDKEIEVTLNSVGYKHIVLNLNDDSIGLQHEKSAIDLGGIAVGFTVDRMANILSNEGIESALINHSGDLFAIGAPPENDGWKVGIPSPLNNSEIVFEYMLKNQSLSTSGSYEKYIEVESQRFGHILDIHTGKPSECNLSVTIIAQTSITSDVFSTTLFSNDKIHLPKDIPMEIISIDKTNILSHKILNN